MHFSCSLAKKLCESNSIEGFTLVELKEFSDSDFALRIKNHISWRGKCKGIIIVFVFISAMHKGHQNFTFCEHFKCTSITHRSYILK